MRLTIPFVSFTAVVLLAAQTASVHASAAEPTPRDIKCQWKKHRKAGRYQACVQNAVVEKVKDPLFDLDAAKAACEAAFKTAWELQDANAASLGEVCLDGAGNFDEVRAMLDGPADRLAAWLAGTRWVDNGDGTATDSTTGLQWELKTNDGSVHDKDDAYVWSATEDGTAPDGTAFTVFLGTLNGSADGVCFAGHCDWRLPTKIELEGIFDGSVPGCGTVAPCTTIPGMTNANTFTLSSSTYDAVPKYVWGGSFSGGTSVPVAKGLEFGDIPFDCVRAVRRVF